MTLIYLGISRYFSADFSSKFCIWVIDIVLLCMYIHICMYCIWVMFTEKQNKKYIQVACENSMISFSLTDPKTYF